MGGATAPPIDPPIRRIEANVWGGGVPGLGR